MRSDIPRLAIVVPCFNEEEVITDSFERLINKLNQLDEEGRVDATSFICFVDDGSRDRTWKYIHELHTKNSVQVQGIRFSRNFGHQQAVLAGLLNCKESADVLLSIDADLQHDINTIDKMLEEYQKGATIVYGVRNKRSTDSFVKNRLSEFFYSLMQSFGVDIIRNHADFRLTSKQVIDELSRYGEFHIFLRGIFPSLGFPHSIVYFDEKERKAGETKYSFTKMLKFSIQGITSFSIVPLRVITAIGAIVFLVCIILMIYTFVTWLSGNVVKGWSSTLLAIYFIGGIQLLAIGILGEYIGKIYEQVKARPRFIIQERLHDAMD